MFGHRDNAFRFGCGPEGMHGFQRFHHRFGGEDWGGWPFGRQFGPRGGGRRFGRGDLKYVILDLLKEQPRHGYDIIRAMEDRFHGFYSPSPGSVYPTLQLLEDQGYVTSAERDGKRIYTITDAGQAFLAEREDVVENVRSRMHGEWGGKASPEVRELVQEVAQIGQLLFRQGTRGALHDPETVRRLRDVVSRARTEIEAIFNESSKTVV